MNQKTVWPALLFFALPFLFLSETLTSDRTLYARDLTYLFHPWRTLTAQMLQSGEVPLWNSYEMGGMPFLANCQSAIFYPLTIFFSSMEFVSALKVFHFTHYALAGIGFYLLGLKMNFNRWVALAGSIVFTYNGYMLTRMEFLSVLGTLIWFPWILIFCIKSRNRVSVVVPTIAIAFILTLSLFAGYPQLLILQIFGAVLFSLLFYSIPTASILWLGSISLFLLFSAVQWLPTLELFFHSIRSGSGISIEEAGTYSLPLKALAGLIVPFWTPMHPDQFTGEKFFWIWSGWWGISATFVSLFSIKYKIKKILFFYYFLAIFGILWSMGNTLSWFEPLYKNFFLLRLFRYPPVALYLTVASFSFIVMFGLDQICSAFRSNNMKKFAVIFSVFIITLELWHYGRGLFSSAISSYYRVTYNAVRTIQNAPLGTMMLSPKIDRQRRLPGTSTEDAKLKFRAFLFDLTNLPYRIRSIVPSGEPLALLSFERLYRILKGAGSIKDARPIFNFWNVTHFFTNDTLNDSWDLIYTESDLKVYQNPKAMGEVFGIKKEEKSEPELRSIVRPSLIKSSNQETRADFETVGDLLVVFVKPFYPGWKIFCSDCKIHSIKPLESIKVRDYFQGAFLPPGRHSLFSVYRSTVWESSLLITATGIGSLFWLGFGWIRKIIYVSIAN